MAPRTGNSERVARDQKSSLTCLTNRRCDRCAFERFFLRDWWVTAVFQIAFELLRPACDMETPFGEPGTPRRRQSGIEGQAGLGAGGGGSDRAGVRGAAAGADDGGGGQGGGGAGCGRGEGGEAGGWAELHPPHRGR